MLKGQTGRSPNAAKAVLKGTATALSGGILCAAILAKLVDAGVLRMESIGYGILASHLLVVFMGTRTAMACGGKKGAAAAAVTGGTYYLSLLIVNGLFFGGSFAGMGVTLLLVVAGTLATIMTEGQGRKKKRRRHYKIPG